MKFITQNTLQTVQFQTRKSVLVEYCLHPFDWIDSFRGCLELINFVGLKYCFLFSLVFELILFLYLCGNLISNLNKWWLCSSTIRHTLSAMSGVICHPFLKKYPTFNHLVSTTLFDKYLQIDSIPSSSTPMFSIFNISGPYFLYHMSNKILTSKTKKQFVYNIN